MNLRAEAEFRANRECSRAERSSPLEGRLMSNDDV